MTPTVKFRWHITSNEQFAILQQWWDEPDIRRKATIEDVREGRATNEGEEFQMGEWKAVPGLPGGLRI